MNWRKIFSLLIVAVFVMSALAAMSGYSSAQEEGQYVDTITIDVRTTQATGLGDTAQGTFDVFMQTVEGTAYEQISDEWKDQLGTWRSIGSYNSMYFNPVNTISPYETEVDGQARFNPFAIREVRYAMNFLIDRDRIVNDLYGGYAEPRYVFAGINAPGHDDYFQPILDELGIDAGGDFAKGESMITTAMENAADDPDLEGELRSPSEAGEEYWQYRPSSDAEWDDVEITAIIRIEDTREDIGDYVCDLLNDVGIATERRKMDRNAYGAIVWSSLPEEQEWHMYTGGWIASATVKYQHWACAQMYSGWYGFTAGQFVSDEYKYSNETIDDATNKVANGYVNDLEQYWDLMQTAVRAGVLQSHRIFITSTYDFVPYNEASVVRSVTDVTTGWSSVFSPRTMQTTDGSMEACQYSAQGTLYMDNWNYIGGSSDYYGQLQQEMTYDFGMYLHPQEGTYIDFRYDTSVETDYTWEGENLTTNLDVPSDAVKYNTTTQIWEEVGSDVNSAVKVTYDMATGTWHDDNEFDIQDIMAHYAWQKDMCYDDDRENDFFDSGFSGQVKPTYESIKGVKFNGDENTYTVWGNYTFPAEDSIAGYYSFYPYMPAELYEATSHLVYETGMEAQEGGTDETYAWTEGQGENYVHYISEQMGADFVATLNNLADEDEWLPPYVKEENNAPIPMTESEFESIVDNMASFYDEHGHMWIATGPFYLDEYDAERMQVTMKRWTEDDGYPWPKEYWANQMTVKVLELSTVDAPAELTVGDTLDVSVDGRVFEQYPETTRRDVTEEDDPTVTYSMINTGTDEIEATGELTFNAADSTFSGSIDTADLSEGVYELSLEGSLPAQVTTETTSKIIVVTEEGGAVPGMNVISLDVSETNIKPGDEVTITAEIKNTGETDITGVVTLDGESIAEETIAAGETKTITVDQTFDNEGDYVVSVSGSSEDVTISVAAEEEDGTPGFTLGLLAISAVVALVIYHRRRR